MEKDIIYCKDSRSMTEVDDGSVQLVVTSPPYNVGKEYENYHDKQDLKTYLHLLNEVWKECVRVLCKGGRIAINIANTNRTPYLPLNAYITTQMLDLGMLMRGEVIWDKGASVGTSTAWGSFARASNPVLRDLHEYIMIFSKESFALESKRNHSGITNEDFVNWTRSIWEFPTESAARVGHPSPFPEELPRRLILLYTNEGDLVLDPFMGSGTTAVATKKLGRHYTGYDISEEYCEIAKRRIANVQGIQVPLFDLDNIKGHRTS